jgi:5-methylcytosine-specific restriction endonuclease McrA
MCDQTNHTDHGQKHQRARIGHGTRWRIAARQGFKCALCDEVLGDAIDVDHKVALSAGGSNSFQNLQVLHLHCHRLKSNMESSARNARRSELYCIECDQFFSKHFIRNHIHQIRR